MTHTDAQIEIALLASVERQAKRTAAALERVLRLMRKTSQAAAPSPRNPKTRNQKLETRNQKPETRN